MNYTDPQYWPTLKDLASRIDTLDYYQILNLPHDCTAQHIKGSYYQLARALHPDRFFTIPDEDTKAAVHKIYKRVTESYTILRDEQKRKKYTANILGPERASRLRYDETMEQEEKKEARDKAKVAKTPQGEKSYQAALIDMRASKWDAAYRNIQSALLFEPKNEALLALRDEIGAKRQTK